MTDPVLQMEDLTVRFHLKRGQLTAVDGVTLTVHRSETFGLVGESGCGKSTMARLLIRLLDPDEGQVLLDGQLIGSPDGISIRDMRSRVQMVFQDNRRSAP